MAIVDFNMFLFGDLLETSAVCIDLQADNAYSVVSFRQSVSVFLFSVLCWIRKKH